MTRLPYLPSVITKTQFDEKGFVQSEQGLLVPAYVASAKGFSEEGRTWLAWFYHTLKERKIFALCPFAACGEYLDSRKKHTFPLRGRMAFSADLFPDQKLCLA